MDLKLNLQMKQQQRKSFQYRSNSYSKWKPKLFFAILISFCFGSLLVIHLQYTNIKMLIPLTRSSSSTTTSVSHYPKIAFLFIARNRLPLDVVWDAFFKADKEQRFSIFIHSRPGFLFNKATTRSAYFYGRQISDSIQVDWGEATMILAERILLKNALRDSSNQRFVFLSDSCIPLYNFSYTYDYIMSTTNSFVDSFADTKEGRYNPKMNPVVPVHNWRKGSQWVVLTTKHAEVVIKDEALFAIFQQHCKRKSLPEFWRDRPVSADTSKEHNCIPDEHYVQTLLAQEGLEEEITRRTLTHTSWDLSTLTQRERRGWHPMTYRLSDATPMLIKSIKDIDNVYYETEYRREWCTSKGKPSPCFLFARKFTRPAALQLFNMSVLGASDEGLS